MPVTRQSNRLKSKEEQVLNASAAVQIQDTKSVRTGGKEVQEPKKDVIKKRSKKDEATTAVKRPVKIESSADNQDVEELHRYEPPRTGSRILKAPVRNTSKKESESTKVTDKSTKKSRKQDAEKTDEATIKPSTSKIETPKVEKKKSEMAKAIEAVKESQKNALSGVTLQEIRSLKKDMDRTINQAKRDAQLLEEKEALKKPAKSTRSGLKRGAIQVNEYTQGKIILMGMKDAKNISFTDEELKEMKKRTARAKEVKDLKYESLQYLVKYVLFPELEKIQKGEIKSDFHDRYHQLKGQSKNELYSEMRLTLFTNEQRDYLNGYLQEIFGANKKDECGDINHTLINYVELVMLHETSVRIVKLVHKFETFEETLAYMKKKSREAYGISDDEE